MVPFEYAFGYDMSVYKYIMIHTIVIDIKLLI